MRYEQIVFVLPHSFYVSASLVLKSPIWPHFRMYPTLALTQNENISESFGMRHRAALGISEISDPFAIVASEETGRISVAENGCLAV